MVDFFSGFAQGYANSSQNALQNRRLRDELQLRKEENAKEQERFDATMGMQQKRLELDTEQFGLSKDRFSLEQQQFQSLKEHQAYQEKLDAAKQDLELRKQDLDVAKTMAGVFDPKLSKGVRRAQLHLFGQAAGIDTKSEGFKTLDSLVTSMEDEELAGAKEYILNFLPNAKPGELSMLAKQITEDPTKALQLIQAMATGNPDTTPTAPEDVVQTVGPGGTPVYTKKSEAPGKEAYVKPEATTLNEIADPTSPTGRRLVPEAEASGKPSPAPLGPQYKTPDQIRLEANAANLSDRNFKYYDQISEAADRAVGQQPLIETFRETLKTGKFRTGSFADTRLALSRAAELLGFTAETEGPIGEALKALQSDTASGDTLQSMGSLLSIALSQQVDRLTNMSLSLTKEGMVNLTKTPGGNLVILDLFDRINRRAGQMAEKADQLLMEGGDVPLEAKLREYRKQLDVSDPVVDDGLRKSIAEQGKAGAGINLEAGIEAVEGAVSGAIAGKDTVTLGGESRDYPRVSLPKVGMKDGRTIVRWTNPQTGDTEELPVFWNSDGISDLPIGTRIIWGPRGIPMTWRGTGAGK